MLAALGGAYLSIGFVNSFNQNMTVGRGFIALAAVIFGNWRPLGAAAAALLFGFSSALAQRLPAYSESAARALPGAAVRPHPDRGRRPDRPLDPARRRWPSLQEAVTAGRRAPPARGCRCSSGCSRSRSCPRRSSRPAGREEYDLLHAAAAIPVGARPRASPRSCSPGGPGHGSRRRSATRAGARTARVGRLLGWLGFLPRADRGRLRRASTRCSRYVAD